MMTKETLKELQKKARDLKILNVTKYRKDELIACIANKQADVSKTTRAQEEPEVQQIAVKQESQNEAYVFSTAKLFQILDPECFTITNRLDYKTQTFAVRDTLLHGHRIVYNDIEYRLIINENYNNQHLLRVFLSLEGETRDLILFSYIPKGRFGNIPVYDTNLLHIKRLGTDANENGTWTYEHDFEYHPKENKLIKKIKGYSICHKHMLQDSLSLQPTKQNERQQIIGKIHKFAADPIDSAYLVVKGQFYESDQRDFKDSARKFTCVEDDSKIIQIARNIEGLFLVSIC